jgi:hypothetical protein
MPENDLSMEVGRSEDVDENIRTMKSHSFCDGFIIQFPFAHFSLNNIQFSITLSIRPHNVIVQINLRH